MVVRGDHVGRLAEHPAFTERLGATFALVPPLTDPELREIVREPARTVGLQVDAELLDAVVTDVLGQAGALPLLSTALVGTWERRRGDRLTLAGYLEAGGVAGALTRSAEAAYGALDEAGQDLARRLFVRLADTDDGGALVRRPRAARRAGPRRRPGPRAARSSEVFVDRRLLAVDGERLEVAHEALLTAWPRLVRWLEDDAAGRAVRRHLAPAAREWEAGGRRDDELSRGARLTAALDWADSAGAEITPLEQQFLARQQGGRRRRTDRCPAAGRPRGDGAAPDAAAGGRAGGGARRRPGRHVPRRARPAGDPASPPGGRREPARRTLDDGGNPRPLPPARRPGRAPGRHPGGAGRLARRAHRAGAGGAGGGVRTAIRTELDLADGGRVAFFSTGEGNFVAEVGALESRAGPPEQAELGMEHLDRRRCLADRGGAARRRRSTTGRPWVRTIASDGSTRQLAEGPAIGGLPLGRCVQRGRAPGAPARHRSERRRAGQRDALEHHGDRRGRTDACGTRASAAPSLDRPTTLLVDFSDDGEFGRGPGHVGSRCPHPDRPCRRDGRSSAPRPARPAAIADVRALSSGAALLWDDGVVTLTDRSGSPVQQLDAHQDAGAGCRRRPGRDVGRDRRRWRRSHRLGHRPGDRPVVGTGGH